MLIVTSLFDPMVHPSPEAIIIKGFKEADAISPG